MEHPELEQIPEQLREKVVEYLVDCYGSKILTAKIEEVKSVMDDPKMVTSYKVYVERLNTLSVFWFREDFKHLGAMKSSMIAGDIDVFLEHSSWFKGRDQL